MENNTIETKYYSFVSFFTEKKEAGYRPGVRKLLTKKGEEFKVLRLVGESDVIDIAFSSKLEGLENGTGVLSNEELLKFLQDNKDQLQVQLSQAKDKDGNPIFYTKGSRATIPCLLFFFLQTIPNCLIKKPFYQRNTAQNIACKRCNIK